MSITILGYICLAYVLLVLVLRKPDFLLYGAVFFSGFSCSSVLNVGDVSIQPSLFLFALYLVPYLLRKGCKIALPKLLVVFFLYCLSSILSTVLLSGSDIIVMDQQGLYSPLVFSSTNLIHVGYLFVSLLFLNCLLRFDPHKRDKLMTAYRIGFYAVVLICLYQIFAFQYDLPFDEIFRQSPNGNVQSDRLYGPCAEASMLCYYLIPSIFIVLFFGAKRKWLNYLFAFLSVLIGFMTSSSTFLVGSAVLLLFAIGYFVAKNATKKLTTCLILIVAGIVLLEVLEPGTITRAINSFSEKLARNNGSGQERFGSFEDMFSIGLRYPFGVGFGSARSKDLLSTWACNVGIFGLAIYLAFLFMVIARGGRKNLIYEVPFLITNLMMFTSVPEPYYFFVWFLCFVALAGKGRSKIFVFDQWHKVPKRYSNCALPIVMLSAKSNVSNASASVTENAEAKF